VRFDCAIIGRIFHCKTKDASAKMRIVRRSKKFLRIWLSFVLVGPREREENGWWQDSHQKGEMMIIIAKTLGSQVVSPAAVDEGEKVGGGVLNCQIGVTMKLS